MSTIKIAASSFVLASKYFKLSSSSSAAIIASSLQQVPIIVASRKSISSYFTSHLTSNTQGSRTSRLISNMSDPKTPTEDTEHVQGSPGHGGHVSGEPQAAEVPTGGETEMDTTEADVSEVKSPVTKKTKSDSQSPNGTVEGDQPSTDDGVARSPSPDPALTLEDIVPWNAYKFTKKKQFDFDPALNAKVSLYRGDISLLKIDAIVNAANDRLLPGGGVCGAIHDAAGEELAIECKALNGCDKGDAKITGGHNLPAKHVIHTVGPMSEKPDVLVSCYQRCFTVLLENNLRSIAFPCVGTGIYGFPNERAAKIALTETRDFLEQNHEKVDRVIFCVFMAKDLEIYERFMPIVFPLY